MLARCQILIFGASPASEDKVCIPPIPGSSNWVQLGPASIPYGQTNSNKRVFVTGRVTTIVTSSNKSRYNIRWYSTGWHLENY